MKTVYITRNALFKPLHLYLFNNINKADPSFFEDNIHLFEDPCETCNGTGEIIQDGQTITCDECNGDGYHETEPYQYFLCNCDKYDIERLKEYGIELGHSELLDEYILPIYDFGTGWSAFSYSKEVSDDYELNWDETETRTTTY